MNGSIRARQTHLTPHPHLPPASSRAPGGSNDHVKPHHSHSIVDKIPHLRTPPPLPTPPTSYLSHPVEEQNRRQRVMRAAQPNSTGKSFDRGDLLLPVCLRTRALLLRTRHKPYKKRIDPPPPAQGSSITASGAERTHAQNSTLIERQRWKRDPSAACATPRAATTRRTSCNEFRHLTHLPTPRSFFPSASYTHKLKHGNPSRVPARLHPISPPA